jgi:DNA-binding transcriptional MocR family regulator
VAAGQRSWSFAHLEFLYFNRSIVLQLDGMGPLYRQICRAFRNDILTRALPPGERVPSTRALAGLLKVSRNTAVLAYEQLLAEGYLETRVGAAGTVVAAVLPPDSFRSHSSESLDRKPRTASRSDARLAIVGERILKAARATTDSLGLPSLTWELTPPRLRYDFRPGRAAFPDLPYALWCRLLGGVALPIARRLELLDWASRVGAFIVEDDYDSEYRYDGPPLQALAGLDREGRVIYVGTFSKILFPALRLEYLVLLEALVEPVVAAKAVGDTGTAILEQLALADFISTGHFDRHLRRTNASNAARRNALVAAVRKEFRERAEVCGANAGLHLLVWLKGSSGGMIADVHGKAEKAGVGLYAVEAFYMKPPKRTGVVLGYAPLPESEIREGIRCLAEALK